MESSIEYRKTEKTIFLSWFKQQLANGVTPERADKIFQTEAIQKMLSTKIVTINA